MDYPCRNFKHGITEILMTKKRIAIFASGSGTNAEAIMSHFKNDTNIEVSLVLANKPNAYVLKRAEKFGVENQVFNRQDFYESTTTLDLLQSRKIDYIILAGFLWLVPKNLILSFREKIINIHPSLIPNHCGKGMYGDKVHQSVINSGDSESGITIHLVDEIYDNGRVLRQEKVAVTATDSPDSLATKIHELEHAYFPQTIEDYILEESSK